MKLHLLSYGSISVVRYDPLFYEVRLPALLDRIFGLQHYQEPIGFYEGSTGAVEGEASVKRNRQRKSALVFANYLRSSKPHDHPAADCSSLLNDAFSQLRNVEAQLQSILLEFSGTPSCPCVLRQPDIELALEALKSIQALSALCRRVDASFHLVPLFKHPIFPSLKISQKRRQTS